MPTRRRRATAPIARKQPSQERATVTVDAIVTAVERILEKHGADGLTTNRVAEIAGVSVGTLYQYFPNEGMISAAGARSNVVDVPQLVVEGARLVRAYAAAHAAAVPPARNE